MLVLAAKKIVTITSVAEAAAAAQQQEKVPVDQFKAFCVYEDENRRPAATAGDVNTSDLNISNINLSLIR